jgi:polyhydroxyalkanoate synthase subunit PhaC
MTQFPIQIRHDDIARELAEIERKVAIGLERLTDLKEDDVDIGSTPKDLVYARETWELYHYKPLIEFSKVHPIPMLIVPPLINGYEVADLQPDRSLVRNFLNAGMDVYLVNWGYPSRSDMHLKTDDYVCDFIDDIVDFIRRERDLDKINLFGICQGGTMSTCYSALFPEKVRNLVLTVTPIDFSRSKVEGLPHVGLLFEMGLTADVDLMFEAFGVIPSDVLNISFLMASPFTLMFGKYADTIDMVGDRNAMLNFLRMEKWLFSGPGVAGATYRDLIKKFLQGNQLVKVELELDGRKVDLGNLTMPILNIYAERDHLVPPNCTIALGEHVGNKKDYKELPIKTGHIGIYTGGASQKLVAPSAAEWLKER